MKPSATLASEISGQLEVDDPLLQPAWVAIRSINKVILIGLISIIS
jgi:hypothetical protein